MAQFAKKFAMDLSETVTKANGKKEHKRIATVQIPFPTLEEFGIQAKQAVYGEDDTKTGAVKGQPAFDGGVPVYDDSKMDWLQQAIVDKVKAYSRNRFLKGELKAGMSLAEDFDTLTADTQRTGEALKLRREAKDSFQAYLAKLGKQAATVTVFGDLFFNSNRVLASASDKYVGALDKWVGQWVDTLDDAAKTRFMPKLTELNESITAAKAKDDLEADLEDAVAA